MWIYCSKTFGELFFCPFSFFLNSQLWRILAGHQCWVRLNSFGWEGPLGKAMLSGGGTGAHAAGSPSRGATASLGPFSTIVQHSHEEFSSHRTTSSNFSWCNLHPLPPVPVLGSSGKSLTWSSPLLPSGSWRLQFGPTLQPSPLQPSQRCDVYSTSSRPCTWLWPTPGGSPCLPRSPQGSPALPNRATCQAAAQALHLTIAVTDRDVTREYMAEYHPAENDV